MKPQRITSARFISLRAPITSAPPIAKRINAYIPSAERRVNSHMNISKLRPRLVRGRVLDLVAMLASRRADDYKYRDEEDRDKERPLHPDRLALVYKELRE